jgi:hypothetical protein
MYKTGSIILLTFIVLGCLCGNLSAGEQIVWDINNITSIAGHNTTVIGSPKVIETDKGKAVYFDGIDDALVVDALAISRDANAFTIEVIIRPDPNGRESEQKFLHIQENNSSNRIVLLAGQGGDNSWYFDSFVRVGEGKQNLWDTSKTHPAGNWYNAAIVCDGKRLGNYVNGALELKGPLQLLPFSEGKTAIGAKISGQSPFKGAILKIRFTPGALKPREFLKP